MPYRLLRCAIGLLAAASVAACGSGETGTGGGGATGASTSSGSSSGSGTTSSTTGGSGGTTTTSSSSGGGGSGGSTGCTPGELQPCYTGPEGTMGVGACKAGVAACNPTGVGYGPCMNQVVPKPEVCGTPVDDDCNGQANEVCICEPFSQAPCYTGPLGTLGVGTCVAGYKVCQYTGLMYGSCIAEIIPGVENCASAADEDCDGQTPPCTGAHVFSKAFGGPQDEAGVVVATDKAGNVLFAGSTVGSVDLGCGALAGGAAGGGVIAKLDPAGACLWNKRFGDGAMITGAGADLIGNVVLTGTFSGIVDFGGGPVTSAGQTDVFFVKLDPQGNFLWARRFGGAGPEVATGLAVDDSNSPIGIGQFQGSIDFGDGAIPSEGGDDLYLVKLDPAGGVLWAKTFGDAADEGGARVAVDIGYGVLVTGTFHGTIDFGGGPLVSAGQGDVFVAKIDTTGEHLWSKSFGDAQDQTAGAIGADRSLNVYVTGSFAGGMNFGGGALVSAGGQDTFLVSFDLDGAHRWSKRFGDAGTQAASALAVDVFGNVALGVALQGSADFGGGALASVGASDIAIAKYDPTGLPLWSKRFGGAAAEVARSLAYAPSGALWMTGVLPSAVDFGGGPVSGGGGEDAWLSSLAP